MGCKPHKFQKNKRAILSKNYIRIKYFVFMQNWLNHFFITKSQWNCVGKFNTSSSFSFKIYIWTFFVETNTNSFQFFFEKSSLKNNFWLKNYQFWFWHYWRKDRNLCGYFLVLRTFLSFADTFCGHFQVLMCA